MEEKARLHNLLSRLWVYISNKRRKQLIGLGFLMLLGSTAEILSIGMVVPFLGALMSPEQVFIHPWAQPLVNYLNIKAPHQILLPLTVFFVLASLLSGIMRFILLWVQTRLGNSIGNDLGSEAFRRTLYQPYAVHVLRNSSEVVSVLMVKINTVIYFIIIPLLTLLTSVFIALTILIFMFWVQLEITLIALAGFGCIYICIVRTTKKRLIKNSQRVNTGQKNLTQIVQEGLGGIRDVLIDSLQETYSFLYCKTDRKVRRALSNIAIMGGAPRPLVEAFGMALLAFLAYTLTDRPGGVAVAIPMLGALALTSQRLMPLVQQVYASWTSMLGGQSSLIEIIHLLDQPIPALGDQSEMKSIIFQKKVCISDMNFRYTPEGSWVLRGINLQILRGSRIGFIGETGSGKSTLLDILMGLLTPSEGTLSVDGTVVSDENRRAWHALIAHVPQVIYLADVSVAENIAFGISREDIDLQRVREVAHQAQIGDTIESWKNGYNTFVGERGIRLSGGQRQRIGIARALYKNMDIIIFDEATSSLDDDTERMVMEAIDFLSKELTIVIVAHRISTLKNCDQVVEVNKGMITRIGTYREIYKHDI
jgi:ATP-binding cassette, subfamily B, bacterial PglK